MADEVAKFCVIVFEGRWKLVVRSQLVDLGMLFKLLKRSVLLIIAFFSYLMLKVAIWDLIVIFGLVVLNFYTGSNLCVYLSSFPFT